MPLSTDWATIASFATAFGTLVLALATFASIRSANRSARIAEAAFQANLRPVLVTSRLDDPVQKIRWMDNHWAVLQGAQGIVELADDNIYLSISLRNAGSGLAVAQGWAVMAHIADSTVPHLPTDRFRRQQRDLYIAADDIGFWQAALRDPADPEYAAQGHRGSGAVHSRIALRRPRGRPAHHLALRDDPVPERRGRPVVPDRLTALEPGPAGPALS